ncbi:hypothetical protein EVAR_100256_1 [Eumeta japonica]|uniref:Uncharacterized protein n=1 Tax=Eumeta variegata TaxID=151549 RepID=A0A4C1SJV9_EUMVA|nr:hypothetical protein EVAR_100256_1 [Eumeta japonica]
MRAEKRYRARARARRPSALAPPYARARRQSTADRATAYPTSAARAPAGCRWQSSAYHGRPVEFSGGLPAGAPPSHPPRAILLL